MTMHSIMDEDGPDREDFFPVGTHVTVHHHYSPKIIGTGRIFRIVDGLTDFGGPDSGPGPVEESTHAIVMLDSPVKQFSRTVLAVQTDLMNLEVTD